MRHSAAILFISLTSACCALLSCSSSDNNSFSEPQNTVDSIAYFLGYNNGYKMAADFDSIIATNEDGDIKERFENGFKEGLMTDSADQSMMLGFVMASMIEKEANRFDSKGVIINKQALSNSFKEVFIDKNIDSLTLNSEIEELKQAGAMIRENSLNTSLFDADRIAKLMGHVSAKRFLDRLPQARTATGEIVNPQSFYLGIDKVLTLKETDKWFCTGFNLGFNLLSSMLELKPLDINIDPERTYFHFSKAFNSSRRLSKAEEIISINILNKLIDKAMSECDEAQMNLSRGKDYIDSLAMHEPKLQISQSSLAYIIKSEGNGRKVMPNEPVMITFEGKHLDGRTFDYRENPIKADINQLIPGLREGISLLNHGGEATLIIPANLAYGAKGQPASIRPMETLIYTVKVY